MNRQFQNFNQNSFVDNQNSIARNMSVFGNKQDSIRYMERPGSMNVSQMEYNRNQPSGHQPSSNRPIYNPNPFGNDTNSMSNPFSNDVSSIQSNMIPSQMSPQNNLSNNSNYNNNRKEIGVLFFSNNCSHSRAFLTALYKTPFNDLVRKICIDKGDVKIPRIITEVPTLIARGIQRPLVGDQVGAWLENELQKGSSQKSNADLGCYSFSGKDNYSVIGEVNDDMSVCNSFADWDKDYYINAPLDSDKGEKKKSTMNSSQISDMGQISKLRNERDSMFTDQRRSMKNTQIDPEKFNEMFVKQQQKTYRNNLKNI